MTGFSSSISKNNYVANISSNVMFFCICLTSIYFLNHTIQLKRDKNLNRVFNQHKSPPNFFQLDKGSELISLCQLLPEYISLCLI